MLVKPKKLMREKVKFQDKLVLDPITRRVGKELISYVIEHRENPFITYKDLSRLCGGTPHYHLEMDSYLGDISSICRERGLPPISCVVCTQEEHIPAAGFFKAFYPGVPSNKWLDVFVKCIKEIQECNEWEALLEDIE